MAAAAAALAATCLALAPAHAGAAPPPRDFFGIQAWKQPTGQQLTLLGSSKVRVFRSLVLWSRVERRRPTGDCTRSCTHTYDWRPYDYLFRLAAGRGVRIVPVLAGSPSWAAVKPQWQPRSRSAKKAFDDFARAAAERYGPTGTLWTKRPWSPAAPAPRGVRADYWQVWNEPNIATSSGRGNYWYPRPDPGEYAGMLRRVGRSLKRASTRVQVMSAGVPWPQYGIRAETFMSRVLRVSGVLPVVDVVAVHPYARQVSMPGQEDVMDHMAQMRSAVNSSGGRDKELWVTEIGWATGIPDGRFTVTERQQNENLDELYRRLLAIRSGYRLLGAMWFSLKDEAAMPGHGDYWGLRSGLLKRDMTPKPSWRTFRSRAINGY